MKRKVLSFISLIMIISMAITITGCGGNNNQEKTENTSKISTENKKIVNDDGEEFIIDTTKKGEIKKDAESLNSDVVVLLGKEYTFPIKMSELFDNGWRLNNGYEYQTEFDANTTTDLLSYYLVDDESGKEITLGKITNNSSEKKDIKDCWLTDFEVDQNSIDVAEDDFIIPGGITFKSLAADVLSVYGNPNNTDEFTGYSYSQSKSLIYSKQKSSGISYTFSFYDDDNTLYTIQVEMEE